MNPFGTAPYFRDTSVSPVISLSESGAIIDYILTVYGNVKSSNPAMPRLLRSPGDSDYGDYLQWLHFANGSLQPAGSRLMTFLLAGMTDETPIVEVFTKRHQTALHLLDDQLSRKKYLAGDELSAADIMTVCPLTTMRGFCPVIDLGPYQNILRYLQDIAERPAYRQALKKGDKGMEPMISARVKPFVQFAAFKPALQKYN